MEEFNVMTVFAVSLFLFFHCTPSLSELFPLLSMMLYITIAEWLSFKMSFDCVCSFFFHVAVTIADGNLLYYMPIYQSKYFFEFM